jgi:hypothetical protein
MRDRAADIRAGQPWAGKPLVEIRAKTMVATG